MIDEPFDARLTPKKNVGKKDKQRLFLEEFAKHAIVLTAARSAGVSRQMVYKWLEHDQDFSFAYNLAKEDARDVLRTEIYRRAKEGWDEKVYQLGNFAGTVHKYSDTLLIFHSKALMPEYREKQQLDVNTTTTNTQDIKLLHDAIATALADYPDARIAVAAMLAEKGRAS